MDDFKARLFMSVNPMLYISSKKYNEKECYYFKLGKYEEYTEKDTGFLLYMKNDEERIITYDLDTVTDKDVEKPDLSKYEVLKDN